jgi:hypothetical protein
LQAGYLFAWIIQAVATSQPIPQATPENIVP